MRRGKPGQKGRRGQRVGSVIRQIVSEALVMRLNDPRLAFMTVTNVEVSADMRFADVNISVMGDLDQQTQCLRAIQHAHGRLQESICRELAMKFCPVLRFHLDQSVKRSVSMSAMIAKARAEDEAARADRIRRGVEPAGEPSEVPEESAIVLHADKVDEDDEDDEDEAEDEGDEDDLDDADEMEADFDPADEGEPPEDEP